MASFLRPTTAEAISAMTPVRAGERKLGETVRTMPVGTGLAEGLRALPEAGFVVVLVPEDIGVRGNGGRPGAAHLAQAALRRLLAMQDNALVRGASIVVAGEVAVQDLMQQAVGLDASRPADLARLHALTAEVDARVSAVVAEIAREGRRVILLGGGHENAFGLLAGLRAALAAPLACVNLDAHADLRADAGRHSGNPFSKAIEAGHLDAYAMIGLHESYLNEHMATRIAGEARLHATTLDAVLRGERTVREACEKALVFVGHRPCSLEVDLDVVAGMSASAASPSGLSADEVRRCVCTLAAGMDARALHICEGIPGEGDASGAGKLAALIACDFIKAVQGRRA